MSEKKKFAESLNDAKEWHKKMLIRDSVYNWFHAAQQLAWETQAKSGLTEHQIRLALKFGVRWRRIVFASARKRPKKSALSSASRIQMMYVEGEMGFGPVSFQPRLRAEPRVPLFLESAVRKVIQPPMLSSTPVLRIDSKLDMEDTEEFELDKMLHESAIVTAKLKEEKVKEQKKLYFEIKEKLGKVEEQLKDYCETQPLLMQKSSRPKIDFADLLQQRERLLSELSGLNSLELVQNHVLGQN